MITASSPSLLDNATFQLPAFDTRQTESTAAPDKTQISHNYFQFMLNKTIFLILLKVRSSLPKVDFRELLKQEFHMPDIFTVVQPTASKRQISDVTIYKF